MTPSMTSEVFNYRPDSCEPVTELSGSEKPDYQEHGAFFNFSAALHTASHSSSFINKNRGNT